jgi:hypothetical protein
MRSMRGAKAVGSPGEARCTRGWSRTAPVVVFLVIAAGTIVAAEPRDDSWFLLSMGGAPVGHAHRTARTVPDSAVVTRITTSMEFRRLGEALSLTSEERWRETADGFPVAYHLTRKTGAEEVRLEVRVDDGLLAVEKQTGSGTFAETLEFDGTLLFPEGQRRLHASRGFVPGDRYSYLVFDPDFEDVSRVEVTVIGAGGSRAAAEGAGRRGDPAATITDSLRLHRLAVRSELYGDIEFRVWLDDRGLVWREEIPSLGLVSQAATREEASRAFEAVDIIAGTMIETNARIEDPTTVDEALYEIWIEGDDISTLLPEDQRQSFEGSTDRGVLLRVRRVVPAEGDLDRGGDAQSSVAECIEANALLEVSDPAIRAAAARAVGDGAGGPWTSAQRIERYVFETMESVGFGSAFASALEVLRHRTGDCSEYAVLAAALSRAVGIPSRVVSGIVHTDGRFAYHMWIEVWAGGGWFALDPTIGAGSVDATHIKLAASSLRGGAVGDLSLAIMRALNRLGVNVVEYRQRERATRPGAPR